MGYIFRNTTKIFKKLGLNKLRILKELYKKTRPYFKANSIMVNGNKIFLDTKDSLNLTNNKNYETMEVKKIRSIVKKGNQVFDIGANIGYHTLLLANLVGPKGKVYSFEPDKTNFSILQKNIKTNSYNNVVLTQKAVTNTRGTSTFCLNTINYGGHSIVPFSSPHTDTIVKTTKLDDRFPMYKIIDFIKIDIQGSEYKALLGMKKLIKRSNNLKMIIEMNIERLGEPQAYRLYNLLRHLKFRIYNFDYNLKKIVLIKSFKEILKYIKTTHQQIETNLYCEK